MTPNESCTAEARRRLDHPAFGSERSLNDLLRMLGRWRAHLLSRAHLKRHGPEIVGGPFAGMTYLSYATEGCLLPRLLGTYESELHPTLQSFVDNPPDAVIDIGCAEGYYAVGLARLMPTTPIFAYDIDADARRACAELCALNGVSERVSIREAFLGETFAEFSDRSVLALMDAEGFEDDLLKPDDWPALRRMSLIVETHDVYRPGVMQRLIDRFSATHDIQVLRQQPKTQALPEWFDNLGHLDQLLAVWEFRKAPTPWLVMRPK
jgi:hypothetical protein